MCGCTNLDMIRNAVIGERVEWQQLKIRWRRKDLDRIQMRFGLWYGKIVLMWWLLYISLFSWVERWFTQLKNLSDAPTSLQSGHILNVCFYGLASVRDGAWMHPWGSVSIHISYCDKGRGRSKKKWHEVIKHECFESSGFELLDLMFLAF